jgi:hypothetical protein
MPTPAEENRAQITRTIQEAFEKVGAQMEKQQRITEADVERVRQAYERQQQQDQANFLAMVLGSASAEQEESNG